MTEFHTRTADFVCRRLRDELSFCSDCFNDVRSGLIRMSVAQNLCRNAARNEMIEAPFGVRLG